MRYVAGLLLAVCILPAGAFAQAIAYDFSSLYETASPAVVQITTDTASASGFLVTPFGHIATNYHVIRGCRYLAVQFPNGKKVKAAVAAVNPQYDMAILKVNSEVVEGIKPLKVLTEDRDSTVKVGVPVVAIGSPLNQKFLMTQGIVSKVEDTILMGDFLLQAGNSGGPLLNPDGEVVAINTFGEGSIGGAVRVMALRAFLSSPELLAESMAIEPPTDQLRSVSAIRYPVSVLNMKIENETLDLDAYKFKAGDFTVTSITPVLIGKLFAMHNKRHSTNPRQTADTNVPGSNEGLDEPYYEWQRSTEAALDYAVTFDIRPETGPTDRSIARRMIPPMFRFGKIGKTDMEFKGKFLEFRIYRDGELLDPIMPGRQILDGVDQKKQRVIDEAYGGSYIYSPQEFLTGNEFRMQIIDARNPNAIHREVVFTADSKLIKQLRADFTFPRGVLITQTR
jgi:hypothetical protein